MAKELLNRNLEFTSFYPDTLASQKDVEDSFPVWERKPGTETIFPPSLLSTGLAFDSIENNGFVAENVRRYIEANVRTQAFEAVAPGVIMETYQAWSDKDREMVAYGFSTAQMYKKGLADIPRLKQKFGEKVDFEADRRRIELLDSISLNNAVDSGIMDTHQKIVISPFPVGADKKTAKEIGYFAEKGIAMIRTYNFDQETKIMKVEQIAVEKTDLDAFTKIVSLLEGKEISNELTPPEILSRQMFLPKDKLKNGVLDLARIYDRILEAKSGNRHFLGSEIGETEKDYPGIVEKTRKAESETARIVDHLVETNIEMAKSLKDGRSTDFVRNSVLVALQRSMNGDSFISEENSAVLGNSLGRTFDIRSAEALMDFVTKNNYLAMICLTNPERAEQIFDPDDVKRFKRNYLNDPSKTIVSAPPLTPNRSVAFYFCGSMMTINAPIYAPIGGMSLPGFGSFIREDAGDGKGPLEFECPKGHTNTRPFGGTIPACRTCGVSVGC